MADGAVAVLDVFYQLLHFARGGVQAVVKRIVLQQFAEIALPGIDHGQQTVHAAQNGLELTQQPGSLGQDFRNVLRLQRGDFATLLYVLRVSAFGDVDVLVAQQVGGADGGLGIVRESDPDTFAEIFISISTVRFGSCEPESCTLPIWPMKMPFSRTCAFSAMPAESFM